MPLGVKEIKHLSGKCKVIFASIINNLTILKLFFKTQLNWIKQR